MISIAADMWEQAEVLLGFFTLVFARVAAAVAVLPAFGEASLSQRTKLAIALALTTIVAPSISTEYSDPLRIQFLFQNVGSEIVIGLALGLSFRLLVISLQVCGTIAAQASSLAQVLGTANNVEPLPAIGHLLGIAALALAAILDFHIGVIELFLQSYLVAPIGAIPSGEFFAHYGVSHVARAFSLALSLAAPFVIASFLYNIAIGLISRAMPQLMIALIGAPAIIGIVLLLVFAGSPIILQTWAASLESLYQSPLEIAQ